MYAIVAVNGTQYKVTEGQTIRVNRLAAQSGGMMTCKQVLLASRDGAVQVGRPYLGDAVVTFDVLGESRGPKTLNFRFRRRDNYKRLVGGRQQLTVLRVKNIEVAK